MYVSLWWAYFQIPSGALPRPDGSYWSVRIRTWSEQEQLGQAVDSSTHCRVPARPTLGLDRRLLRALFGVQSPPMLAPLPKEARHTSDQTTGHSARQPDQGDLDFQGHATRLVRVAKQKPPGERTAAMGSMDTPDDHLGCFLRICSSPVADHPFAPKRPGPR